MTMRIIYLKIHDGHQVGEEAYTERSLAIKLCENGSATPYQTYINDLYNAEQEKIRADAEAKAEAEKAAAYKKVEEKRKADKDAAEKAKKDTAEKAKKDAEAEVEAETEAEVEEPEEDDEESEAEKTAKKKPGRPSRSTKK